MRRVVAYRLRADVRHRWRSLAGLALLIAVLGGLVLALVAGARRTSSAYERLSARINPPELLVSPLGEGDTTPFYEDLGRLDGVRALGPVAGIKAVPEVGTPSERLAEDLTEGAGVVASVDGTVGDEMGAFHIVDGRMPHEDRADEVLATERFATRNDVAVGDRLDLVLLASVADNEEEPDRAPADAGRPWTVTVTGIGTGYDEVIPFSQQSENGSIFATPALAALTERRDWNFEGAFLDLAPGADREAISRAAEELATNEHADVTGGEVFISDEAAQVDTVIAALQPIAVALGVSAAAVGAVALIVVGQALARSNRSSPAEADALLAAGLRPRDRVAFDLTRALTAGVLGALGAVALALLLSARFPTGVARQAEPAPGLRVDLTVLAGGAAALALVATASALPGAVRAARHRGGRSSRILGMATVAAALPPPAAQGTRFALFDRGPRPLPARSTLVVGVVAIASVMAAATFAVSLTALVTTPARYGAGWDRLADGGFGPIPVQVILDELGDHPSVAGIAVGDYGAVEVEGRAVPAISLTSVDGEVSVTLEDGAPPRTADEIVLGGAVMDELDLSVGDEVSIVVAGEERSMVVTGRGVFPRMGQGSFSTTGLGTGALVSAELPIGASIFAPEDLPPEFSLDGRIYTFAAIDVDGDPSVVDGPLDAIAAEAKEAGAFVGVRDEFVPTKVKDLQRVQTVPVVTAGLLALVAVAALAHLLVVSVRERRRELALLRTLGFTRRQLRATVGWHAAVVVAVALVVGLPLGLAAGRVLWRWFEDGLHAASPAEVPWVWLVLAVPVAVLVGQLVAAVPGHRAATTRPAVALREE